MALPLPVTEQPLATPFEAPVLAEAQLLFDLTGVDPLPAIEDVVTVDFYLSGRVTNKYSFYQTGGGDGTESRPVFDNDGGNGMPEAVCPIPQNFFGPGTPTESVGFFPVVGVPITEPAVTSLFEWLDVASFYWWESPYPILDAIDPVEPYVPPVPDEFFNDGDPLVDCENYTPPPKARVGVDFFLGRTRGLACDPISLEVLAPAAVELEGLQPGVVITENVFVRPIAGNLLLAGFAPALVLTENLVVRPAAAGVELEGFAPAIELTDNIRVEPAAASVEVAGQAPTVFAGERVDVMPATAVITLAGQAPSVAAAGIPCNAVYYNGEVVYYEGEVVTFGTLTADTTGVTADSTCGTADFRLPVTMDSSSVTMDSTTRTMDRTEA
jgi:hypothetical protein